MNTKSIELDRLSKQTATMNGSCSSLQPTPPFTINILWPTGADGSSGGSPVSHKTSPPPPPPLESYLPGVYRDEGLPQLSTPSLTASYLVTELGLGRLDGFNHHWFWLLGQPALPRPLHDCSHRGRTICVTERMDRHLGLGLGSEGGRGGGGGKRDLLYLKPLPRFLLDTRFWEQVLACECKREDIVVVMTGRRSWGSKRSGNNSSAQSSPRGSLRFQPQPQTRTQTQKTMKSSASAASTSSTASTCEKRHLWDCALGFLYSYAALVAHESDFRIAQEHGLLPAEVTWTSWRALTRQVIISPDVVAHRFHQRFLYGEMMLHRLREISQLKRGGLVPVLIGRLDRFARFFQGNVRWLASLVAYIAIVLSALQTGLTTDVLAASSAFQAFSSGFTMFALTAPLSILLGFGFYFGLSLVYHVGVHLVTSHLFVGTARQAMIVDGVNAFQHHWGDSKSEV